MKQIIFIHPAELHPHENISMDAARRILETIEREGQFTRPVLIDTKTKVILDGHHRWWAGRELGCVRLPCWGVDYLTDDHIIVQSRRPGVEVTKESVIEMGLSGNAYPLKTTRHLYNMPAFPEPIPLERLMHVSP